MIFRVVPMPGGSWILRPNERWKRRLLPRFLFLRADTTCARHACTKARALRRPEWNACRPRVVVDTSTTVAVAALTLHGRETRSSRVTAKNRERARVRVRPDRLNGPTTDDRVAFGCWAFRGRRGRARRSAVGVGWGEGRLGEGLSQWTPLRHTS